MNNNVFSGLEGLGFNDIDNLKVFEKNKEDVNKENKEKIAPKLSPIYNKEITCPICGKVFKTKAVKSSYYRVGKKDTDFFIRYLTVNPYFYDVWLCNNCGYGTLKADFGKIRENEIELVRKNIMTRWQGRTYPEAYDVNIAIERYKLALLNYTVIDAKSSKKAMTCLKIAWMYRILEDKENELLFLRQALEGFNDTYYNESFPIYGMNKYTVMYLIGEINRRVGNNEKALLWLGQVITAPAVSPKLKDLARDQKDLIKEEEQLMEKKKKEEAELTVSNADEKETSPKLKGFFSRLFR